MIEIAVVYPNLWRVQIAVLKNRISKQLEHMRCLTPGIASDPFITFRQVTLHIEVWIETVNISPQ
jgi:hypothetical protein